MNHVLKSSFVASHSGPASLFGAFSFFHSSPVMERKRRSTWNYGGGLHSSKRSSVYTKRVRRMESKRSLLKDVSEYAEYLFQSWKDDDSTVWFRRPYWSKGAKLNGFSSHESQPGRFQQKRKEGFDFCTSDDDDVENIFHGSFGGEKFYYWASSRGGSYQWRSSSGHNPYVSSEYRNETDGETDEDTSVDNFPQPDFASERLALGLTASGPLKLAEIKSAYRTCALRWHPDRHQGTSKAMAEEKFKHCNIAYKSLCDKLTTS